MDSGALQDAQLCGILHVSGGRAVCPGCRRRTRQRIEPGTMLRDFPLYCDKCKQTFRVSYRVPLPNASESQDNA